MKKGLLYGFFVILALCGPGSISAQTDDSTESITESLSKIVADLTKQVAELQTQILKLQTDSTITQKVIAPVTTVTVTRILKLGSEGEDVSEIQKLLGQDAEVFPEKLVTGFFGPLTEAAVKRFQEKHDIVTSGTPETTGFGQVGPKTLAEIKLVLTTSTQNKVPSDTTVPTPSTTTKTPAPTPTPDPTPTSTTTTQKPADTTTATNPNPTPTPTQTPDPTPTTTTPPSQGSIQPYQGAPACPDSAHSTSIFHTLWNSTLGCHYDHEHGENPFTDAVSNAFPRSVVGQGLKELLGNVEIAHTNHSGPPENTTKHGGFKWQVQTATPNDCALDFEGADIAVNALALQYHTFGNYAIELDSRVHSTSALMRQCLPNSSDYGYIYTVQHVDYGQRVSGYQGDIVPYGDNPIPSYADGLAPYFTIDCIGRSTPPCGRYTTYDQYVSQNGNTSTTWTSKSPQRVAPSGSSLFTLLFRARDTYQILDFTDSTQPFTFLWMCSRDNGLTYSPYPGCRHNNSTTRIHEIGGTIPTAWDNKAGFDTDPRVGRITATGYTTRFGEIAECSAPGPDCHPLRLVNAYVGQYGSLLFRDKEPAFTVSTLPERDIYFCSGVACSETTAGATSSGWIGANN